MQRLSGARVVIASKFVNSRPSLGSEWQCLGQRGAGEGDVVEAKDMKPAETHRHYVFVQDNKNCMIKQSISCPLFVLLAISVDASLILT